MVYLCFAILMRLLPLDHPIHVSVSEVDISRNEITWTARVYTDDLFLAVYGNATPAKEPDDPERVKQDIFKYLNRHIHVENDGAGVQWKLSGVQSDPEAIWITLVADIPRQGGSSFSVLNTILLDVYKDQKNIVNIRYLEEKRSMIFEKKDKAKSLSF